MVDRLPFYTFSQEMFLPQNPAPNTVLMSHSLCNHHVCFSGMRLPVMWSEGLAILNWFLRGQVSPMQPVEFLPSVSLRALTTFACLTGPLGPLAAGRAHKAGRRALPQCKHAEPTQSQHIA